MRASKDLLKKQLLDHIVSGKLGPSGSRLPPLRELCSLYDGSYVTLQRAVSELANDGVVTLFGKKEFLTYGTADPSSELAGLLKKRESRTIGLYVRSIENPFFSALSSNILSSSLTRSLRSGGYTVLISSGGDDREKEKLIIRKFISLGCSGIISFPGGHYPGTVYDYCPLPVVFIGKELKKSSRPCIAVNNETAARMAANHLYKAGYKEFVYIGSETIDIASDTRFLGFSSELGKLGKAPPTTFRVAGFGDERGYAPIKRYFRSIDRPVGVFCYHDLIAAGLYGVISSVGKSIPGDVGVVGFDDLFLSPLLRPALSTVSYRYDSMAEKASKLLFKLIEGKQVPDITYVNPVLTVRGSSMR